MAPGLTVATFLARTFLTGTFIAATPSGAFATLAPTSTPLFVDVDPVLVGIIAVLLTIVFAFYLLVRRTLLSFSEGIRDGRRR